MKGHTDSVKPMTDFGVVLHKIQIRSKGRLRYDTAITDAEPKLAKGVITRVRYGYQKPTPLLIKTIIVVHDVAGALLEELLEAANKALDNAMRIRIPVRVASATEVAAKWLEALSAKIEAKRTAGFAGRVKRFFAKLVFKFSKRMHYFANTLRYWAGIQTSSAGYINVPIRDV